MKRVSPSGDDIYDDAALLALAMDDRELAAELLQIFLDEVPKHLADLAAAIQANDSAAVQSAAHALKGSAATVTAARVAAAAQALETMGRSLELTGAPRLLEQLEASLRELNSRLTVL